MTPDGRRKTRMERYRRWWAARSYSRCPPQTKRYLVAATGRTGSTLLCRGLAAEGVGDAEEFWNGEVLDAYMQEWGPETAPGMQVQVSPQWLRQNYVGDINQLTIRGGWVGYKVQWNQAQNVLKAEGLQAILDRTDVVLWCRRRDKVAQAVSWARAMTDGAWHAEDQEGGRKPMQMQPDLITHALHVCAVGDQSWAHTLARWHGATGKPVRQVWYEDLDADYTGTMAGVLDMLGCGGEDVDPYTPQKQRQRDASQEQVCEEFRRWVMGRVG